MSSSLFLTLEYQVSKEDGIFYWKNLPSLLDDYGNLSLRDAYSDRDIFTDIYAENNYSSETKSKLEMDYGNVEAPSEKRYYSSKVIYLSDIELMKLKLEKTKQDLEDKIDVISKQIENPLLDKLDKINKKLDTLCKNSHDDYYEEDYNDIISSYKEEIETIDNVLSGLNDIRCLAEASLQKVDFEASYNGHLSRIICWIC